MVSVDHVVRGLRPPRLRAGGLYSVRKGDVMEWLALWLAVVSLLGVLATLTALLGWARSRKRVMVFVNGILREPPWDYGWDFPADPLPVFRFKIRTGSSPDLMTIVWPTGRREHFVAVDDDVAGFIWIPRDIDATNVRRRVSKKSRNRRRRR